MCILNLLTGNFEFEILITLRFGLTDAGEQKAISIRLSQPTILNNLRLLLWDRDERAYSYYIEGKIQNL